MIQFHLSGYFRDFFYFSLHLCKFIYNYLQICESFEKVIDKYLPLDYNIARRAKALKGPLLRLSTIRNRWINGALPIESAFPEMVKIKIGKILPDIST